MPQKSQKLPELAPDCTGCGACANICPVNALLLSLDADGFYTPRVDASLCLRCHACVQGCPQLRPDSALLTRESYAESRPYAAWALEDEVRKTSSSGGVFTILARRIFALGGSVYGAAWDNQQGKAPHVRHIRVTKEEELCRLRGSKYIQSEIGTVYREVKADLKQGLHVLFSGTPCQAAALRSCLRKSWENLIILDVACHGVPSRLLFDAYVREQELRSGEQIARVDFRNKARGWSPYCVVNHFHSGKSSEPQLGEKNDFMNGFISDIAMNRSCYACHWATQPRVADLTLADFWCLPLVHPKPDKAWTDNKGISLVLANTTKGEQLLHSCAAELFLHKEEWNSVRNTNAGIYRHANFVSSVTRRQSLDELASGRSLPELLQNHVYKRKAKYVIGVLNMNVEDAQGSAAISYALCHSLERMQLSTALIEVDAPGKSQAVFSASRRLLTSQKIAVSSTTLAQAHELNERFGGFVISGNLGSQMQAAEDFSLLDFSRGEKRRVLLNMSMETSQKLQRKSARLLGRFDAVSYTDTNGNLPPVLHAILWLHSSEWEQLIPTPPNKTAPCIAGYILTPTPDSARLLKEAGIQLNLPVEELGNQSVDFSQWLRSIISCNLIVTDSLAALCLALLFSRPFIYLRSAQAECRLVVTMLDMLGLERCLTPGSANILAQTGKHHINWEEVNRRLETLRQSSKQWLTQALLQPRSESLERYIAKVESSVVRRPSRLRAIIQRLRAKTSRICRRFLG